MSSLPKQESRPKRLFRIFSNGIFKENPLLALMIGLCASLAVTTAVDTGLGMGLAMTFVLLMSELVISICKKLIPDSIRIPIFIIVVAAFTTVIDYMLKAWFPDLSKAMGIFIPLITVNCIIMGRVEGFASKQKPLDAASDALGMGLGFTWVLVGIATVRELLGNGTFLKLQVLPASYEPIIFFTLAPGGFFVFALFISLNLFINKKLKRPKPQASCDGCSTGCGMATHCGIPETKGGGQ